MALSTEDLKKRISDILKDADLETTSAKKVRTQLEEEDLSSRKEEIGRIIQEVMDENADDNEEEEDEVDENEDDEDFSPKKNGSTPNPKSDYDSFLDSVMSQLKNLPLVAIVEPRLHHSYNACPLFGCGEMPKHFGYGLDTNLGGLQGSYGNASLPNKSDYYNTMPFGPEPPVPNIKTMPARGFYTPKEY